VRRPSSSASTSPRAGSSSWRAITSRNYEDKDGNHRKATEITVSSVHFCDSKKDGAGAGHQDTGGDFADYPDSSGDFTEVDDNGDLPF
jgi:single-strand DNA-binding protein